MTTSSSSPGAAAPGRHRLQIIGIAASQPDPDIRLGSTGVRHLSDAVFKHSLK